MPVVLAITNTFVPHAVSNKVGVRRRRARGSNAEQREVGVLFSALPIPNVEERGWVGARVEPNVANMPTVADVLGDPLAGSVHRLT